MKPRGYVLVRLLFCFVLLALLNDLLADCYRHLLEVAGRFLSVAGIEDYTCGDICSLRLIAFLSLVVATPGFGLLRRFLALLMGLSVFVAIDLAGFYLWPATLPFLSAGGETLVQLIYGFIWNLLGDLLLPVLLWLVICDKHLGLFYPDADIGVGMRKGDRYSEG